MKSFLGDVQSSWGMAQDINQGTLRSQNCWKHFQSLHLGKILQISTACNENHQNQNRKPGYGIVAHNFTFKHPQNFQKLFWDTLSTLFIRKRQGGMCGIPGF